LLAAEPSAAQKSAGNYPKHHLNVRGLRISIENPAGSVRRGTAPDGTEWSNEMKHHYGYIRGTTGKDKDHLDVFLGPEPHAAHPVHIVNQVNEDGEFDEHKVMLGFKSKKDAIEAYHANYEEGWRGADTVATMAFPKFRQWATSGAKRAPARDAGKIEEPEGYQAGGLVKAATALEQKLVKAGLFDKKLGAVPATAENATALPKALEDAAQELGLYEEVLASGSNRPRTSDDAYSVWAFSGDDIPNTYGYANDVWKMRGRKVKRDTPRLDLFVADPDRRVVAPASAFDWGAPGSLAQKFAAEPRVVFRNVVDMDGSPSGVANLADEMVRQQTQHFLPNLSRSIDMGAVYPLGRPRGQQGYAAGGLVPQQLQGLGGTMFDGPLSPAATAALIGAPGSDLGSGNGGAFGADAGVSGNTAGGISPGTIGQALGVAGQLSGTPELGLMGGVIGAAGAAQGGNYGPAGGLIGGLMGGPLGAAAGSLAGQYGSGTLSGKSVGNAVLGLSMPGYGLANGLSGGALGAGLFGSNGGWSNTGVHTASAPGAFGDWGATAGQTAVAAANQASSQLGMDPMSALMGVTGAFGTAPGGGVFGGGVMGGDYGGAQYGGADAYGGPGMGDYGGSTGLDAMGGYGGDFKRGGRVGYADGGSTGAAFGFFPQLQRRKPANNDRTAAANMPLSAVRGWVAGTLGLPGDIESLGRAALGAVAAPDSYVGRNMDSSPALPTSEFYNEWLPGRNEGASNRLAEGVGNLFGGVGSTFLAKPVVGAARGAMEIATSPAPRAGGRAAQRGVFKAPGGNWTKSPNHSLEQHLEMAPIQAFDEGSPAYDWAAGPWSKYVKNEFGTARDPIRAQSVRNEGALADAILAENYMPDSQQWGAAALRHHNELTGGEPVRTYDNFSESAVRGHSLLDELEALEEYGDVPADWMMKAPPSTQFYGASDELFEQFSHVFDYVNAATRAGKDLKMWGREAMEQQARTEPTPQLMDSLELIRRGLHVDPDDLNKLSVPAASMKTAEWDKYLQGAKQTAELNKGVKSVLKTYPDTGHQWVELAPEGLKAEGQAMKHCVGGYCSSVEDGSTRILSLRGKDGKPAVTVEVRPGLSEEALENAGKSEDAAIRLFNSVAKRAPTNSWRAYRTEVEWRGLDDNIPAQLLLLREFAPELTQPSIVQIKGPANRAPSKDVLPMVQDLIRGTDIPGLETFSDVRDLGNAGLEKVKGDALRPDGYYTRQETIDALKRAGVPDSHISGHLRGAGFGD
jgi:Inorganic Pyrophosphatase/PcfJ-like protein